jgi:hypothetical protein
MDAPCNCGLVQKHQIKQGPRTARPIKVYYISDGNGLVKIGFSSAPGRRLSSLAAGNPNWCILAIEPATILTEDLRREQFKDEWVCNEWHKLSTRLKDWIAFINAVARIAVANKRPRKLLPA